MNKSSIANCMVAVILEDNNPEILEISLKELMQADTEVSEEQLQECAKRAYNYIHAHPEALKQEHGIERMEQQGAEGLYRGIQSAVSLCKSFRSAENQYHVSEASVYRTAQQMAIGSTFTNYLRFYENAGRQLAGDFFTAKRMNQAHEELSKCFVPNPRPYYTENAELELITANIFHQFDSGMITNKGQPVSKDFSSGLKELILAVKHLNPDTSDMSERIKAVSRASMVSVLMTEQPDGTKHCYLYADSSFGNGSQQVQINPDKSILDVVFNQEGICTSASTTEIHDFLNALNETVNPAISPEQQAKVYRCMIDANIFRTDLGNIRIREVDKTHSSFTGTLNIANDWLKSRDALKDLNESLGIGRIVTAEQEHCTDLESFCISYATRQFRQGFTLEQLGNMAERTKTFSDLGISAEDLQSHKQAEYTN